MEAILIGDTRIMIGRGLPRPLLERSELRRRAAVLTQPGARPVAATVEDRLGDEGLEVVVHVLPDRDEAKTLTVVSEVYELLAEARVARDDTIVAVGGGAVTDTAGFVAGTWMRGIEVVHVPTTLLAAVDAAIGGKTALNLTGDSPAGKNPGGTSLGGKNLVGVFWPPRRVIVDLDVLDALPDRIKREGSAEIIKAGLLAAPELVQLYASHGLDVALDEVVAAAIRVKADIVARDPTERGDRALLNLGHTLGHAVEFASRLSHGESVSLGLVAAAAVSEAKLGFEDSDLVKATLDATGLPVSAPPLDRAAVLDLVARDKKRAADQVRMVLLEAIGSPRLMAVTRPDLEGGLDAIGL